MAKYLYFDGVDDGLSIPALEHDLIEVDMYVPSEQDGFMNMALYVNISRDTAYSLSVYNGDIVSNGYTEFVLDKRMSVQSIYGKIQPAGIYIFAGNVPGANAEGNLYDVKIWLEGNLIAHYDMSTGTVQDQTGNGNHAELDGATWMEDDDNGGNDNDPEPEGTPVAYMYSNNQRIYAFRENLSASRQNMYKQSIKDIDSKQIINRFVKQNSKTRQSVYGLINKEYKAKQVISKLVNKNVNIEQNIYKDLNIVNSISQVIFSDNEYIYDTLQDIFGETGRNVLLNFETLQVINAKRINNHSHLVEIYASQESIVESLQEIYENIDISNVAKQAIYKRLISDLATTIFTHADKVYIYQTSQNIFDTTEFIIGVKRLDGKQELFIKLNVDIKLFEELKGHAETHVKLRGDI